MKKIILKNVSLILVLIVAAAVCAGCGSSNGNNSRNQSTGSSGLESQPSDSTDLGNGNSDDTDFITDSDLDSNIDEESETDINAAELTVSFGDSGDSFILHLYDNDTARAIARHVGTAEWRLPIYHYDDYENWEVMQYYDIPSRYEIPSAPETITEEAAGTVYYSEPNRILLFYGDAPAVSETSNKNQDDKHNVTSFTAYNTSILSNRVNGGSQNNSGMTIHKTEDSSGWENGWTGTAKYKNEEQQYADVYKWEQNYIVLDWNPDKTDVATGNFDGLSWKYRDDIGEIVFSGKGKIPDFEEENLPT